MRNLFVILLLLSITGCGINCIEGGQGVSGNSIVFGVSPVAKVENGKLQASWVDTGLDISESETMRLTITGAVNMCPKDFINPKEVIIPAVGCTNNDDIDYKDESIYTTYNNMEAACKKNGKGKVLDKAPTIDVFSLGNEDTFKVSLIPSKVKVTDCSPNALKDLRIIYYSDDDLFEDSGCNKPIKAEIICQNGISNFYMKVKDECKLFSGVSAIKPLRGTEVSTLVHNKSTPYGNKVFYDKTNEWINAPFIYDARTVKFTDAKKLKEKCEKIKELNTKNVIESFNSEDAYRLDDGKEDKEDKDDKRLKVDKDTIYAIKNFTSYEINCACGTICSSNGTLNVNQGSKFATISNVSGDCKILAENAEDSGLSENVNMEDFSKKLEELEKNNNSEMIIQGLSAVFSYRDSKDNSNGYQCFPGNSSGNSCYQDVMSKNIQENSIKSDFNYIYESGEKGPAKLSFSILGGTGGYEKYSGGYNIRVERSCNFMYGRKLYLYVGNSAPTMLPGESGTTELFILDPESKNEKYKSGTGLYVINKDGTDKKSGKIYLGIDARGYEGQFDYSNSPRMESENKYFVTFFVKRWKPNFSKAFVMLRNTLLHILYGLPKDVQVTEISEAMNMVHDKKSVGAVQSIYTNQTKAGSLWRAVQALCTLYIIFSVLGYVIGVVRCTKYDLAVRVAKISIVVGLLSQGSWEFFSDHFFSLFIQGVSDLISAFNGEVDGDNSFAFLDTTVGVLLTGEVWIKLLTLIITGPVGWLVFIMILWAFFVFFICVIEAVIAYLFTILGVAFLGTLAPIFITFLLFQFTKTLFDSWIKMLVNFSLQPIILFAALAFLNQVVLTTLYDVTSFTVCNQCLVGLDLPTTVTEKGAPHDICLLPLLSPVGYSSDLSMTDAVREEQFKGSGLFFGLPFGITSALVLLIAANAMRAFKSMSENIAHSISGSIAGLSASTHAAGQALASVVGLDQETQSIIRNALQNIRSTGKSNVNVVGRSSPNPVHEGKSLEKDGSDGGSGDKSKPTDGNAGAGSGMKGSDGKGDGKPETSTSGDNKDGGERDVSRVPPSGTNVLDTAPSSYASGSDIRDGAPVDPQTSDSDQITSRSDAVGERFSSGESEVRGTEESEERRVDRDNQD